MLNSVCYQCVKPLPSLFTLDTIHLNEIIQTNKRECVGSIRTNSPPHGLESHKLNTAVACVCSEQGPANWLWLKCHTQTH